MCSSRFSNWLIALLCMLISVSAQALCAPVSITINLKDGRTVAVSAINDNVIKVTNFSAGQTIPKSKATIEQSAECDVDVFSKGNHDFLRTSSGIVVSVEKNSGAVKIQSDNQVLLFDDGVRTLKGGKQQLSLKLAGDESYYGAGERGHKLNLAGEQLTMYNKTVYGYMAGIDDISQMNISMPLILSSKGYAILFDDYAAAEIILKNPIRYITESRAPISYYFVNGAGSLKRTVQELSGLTGRQPLPPLWSLGYIVSKYGYHNEKEALGVVDTLKRAGYPLDGIVFDMYWYGLEPDMGHLAWDTAKWPEYKKMLAEFKDKNIKVTTITQPYVLRNGRAIENYNMGVERGLFVKDRTDSVTLAIREGVSGSTSTISNVIASILGTPAVHLSIITESDHPALSLVSFVTSVASPLGPVSHSLYMLRQRSYNQAIYSIFIAVIIILVLTFLYTRGFAKRRKISFWIYAIVSFLTVIVFYFCFEVIKNAIFNNHLEEQIDKEEIYSESGGLPSKFLTQDVSTWLGHGAMWDMSNPDTRKWLHNRYKELTLEGIDGWWGDLGEPEVHPETGLHANGHSAREYHNQYGNDWAALFAELYTTQFPDKRPFIMMRGGTTGLQRYSVFPWSGDVSRSWEGLQPQITIMLHSGLSGLGYMSHDIGGFAIETEGEKQPDHYNPELYVRWMQLGTFSPIMRTHGKYETEPYHYPEHQDIILPLIKERYRWLPYNYTLAYENASEGLPLVRPISFYEDGSNAYDHITDEYLWGKDVLIAPVLTQGATSRSITFPAGEWVDYSNPTKVYIGGSTVDYAAPLSVLPMFVRGGAIIPTADYEMENTLGYSTDDYTFNLFPVVGCEGSYILYEDDLKSPRNLSENKYSLIEISNRMTETTLDITLSVSAQSPTAPQPKEITFVVNNIPNAPKSIMVDEQRLTHSDYEYNRSASSLKFHLKWNPAKIKTINVTL